jgi:hypothetical protein
MRFSVGVNYWPRRSALAMWRRFDAGEIAEDFARIAALGLDGVRFFVRWDDFQPAPQQADPAMLERLEAFLGLAADAGLRTIPVLFCGHMCGVNWLPAWSLDRTAARIRNLYAGDLLEAQLVLARAVGERLRDHPAIRAWDLGHEFSNVCEPSHAKVSSGEHSKAPAAEAEVAAWSRRLATALRDTSGFPVTAGTHWADLIQDRDIRLGSLCAPFAFASMSGYGVRGAFARSRLDPEAVPFLAALTASFSHLPVLVNGFGNPTCPPGKFSAFDRFPEPGEPPQPAISTDDTAFATYPCRTEAENAAYCSAVLERLHADGRLGGYWWCWADYGDELRDEPPFDRAPHERTYGIVRSDGSEKPVAAALSTFARAGRSVMRANDAPTIAADYYYRTLPSSTKTLYDGFLRRANRTADPP